jgi:hypothetical protein
MLLQVIAQRACWLFNTGIRWRLRATYPYLLGVMMLPLEIKKLT